MNGLYGLGHAHYKAQFAIQRRTCRCCGRIQQRFVGPATPQEQQASAPRKVNA